MSRRTGKEGIYTRVIQNKRDKFRQQQIQLEIDNYVPLVNRPEEEKDEPLQDDFNKGIVLGVPPHEM